MSENPSTQEDEQQQLQQELDDLAENPPSKLEDWPDGKAKYKTLGGGEDQNDVPYGEGETANLGPPDVAHHEDGSVTVGGEKVDNPEDYKADESIEIDLSRAKDKADDKADGDKPDE